VSSRRRKDGEELTGRSRRLGFLNGVHGGLSDAAEGKKEGAEGEEEFEFKSLAAKTKGLSFFVEEGK
jgi:hypothetical protein